MTSHTIQDTLHKYDIHPQQLLDWEEALGLSIPTNANGQKLYTRQHLNLFKNIKKHMALGRSLTQIKQIITLPPDQDAQPVERNINQAWGHIPALKKMPLSQGSLNTSVDVKRIETSHLSPLGTPSLQPNQGIETALSLESEALLETFKESAEAIIHPHELTERLLADSCESLSTLEAEASLQLDLSISAPHQALEVPSIADQTPTQDAPPPEEPVGEAPPASSITHAVQESFVEPLALDASSAEEPVRREAESSLETPSEWAFTPAIMPPQVLVDAFKERPALENVFENVQTPEPSSQTSIVEKRSTEASPTSYLFAPLAASYEKQEQSLQILDRLITEKDALQTRLVEAEKLNSHLYNVNNLFNKKVKELTTLIKKMKQTYNENELMKLMDDKAKLQRQLLDAEKDKLDAQRQAEKAKDAKAYALTAQKHLAEELKAQRQGFAGIRFLGNWCESLKLREIQYDTFGLNVEEQRSQHRLIDVVPTRVVGNVAFVTTRYAYPDNTLWQRLETLTLVYLEDNHAQGELQVDYILDGIPVCRAIYIAQLERIS
jgi:DNA-binding transcriptional MerR regulator